MPELPDVEVFKRYLDATSLRHHIKDVEVLRPSMLERATEQQMRDAFEGRHFVSSVRYGKHLLVQTNGPMWLTLHFGMTGFLRFLGASERDSDDVSHPRLVVHFRGGDSLTLDDKRTFGSMGLTSSVEDFIEERRLGPDALTVDEDGFAHALRGKAAVKAALMDQERLAGLGNVYSDEVLFHTRLHPLFPTDRLERKTLRHLHGVMGDVLNRAIESEADPQQMPDNFLLRHRRKGDDCPRCRGRVANVKIAGRTSYFCPECQNRP